MKLHLPLLALLLTLCVALLLRVALLLVLTVFATGVAAAVLLLTDGFEHLAPLEDFWSQDVVPLVIAVSPQR